MLRKFCLLSATLLTMSVPSFAQNESINHDTLSVSLQQAVTLGVRTNPEYGVVASSRRATDEELRQGRAGYLPSVDLNADTGWEHTNDVSTRATADEEEDLWRSQIGLTLTQMLFDGFDTSYEVQRQKARVVSSANRVDETVELVGLSVVEAYLDVLRQRYLLDISNQNVSDHHDILKQIQDGVAGGRSTQADLEQARARLASAQATQANVVESLKNAESQYNLEVGDEAGQLMMPLVPYDSLLSSVKDQIEHTLSHSPTLKIYSSDIEVAYAEAQQTKASFYPQVNFELSGTYADDISGVDTYEKDASALVVMNWNLYRGGEDTARASEFVHRHQQAKEERSEAARAVEDDVRRTWASMVSAGVRAEQFHNQAEANRQVVGAYRDQFDLNRRTLLDVLDSQNELFVSQTNKVNAEFVQMFAVYRLLALQGGLLDALGVQKPEEVYIDAKTKWGTQETSDAR